MTLDDLKKSLDKTIQPNTDTIIVSKEMFDLGVAGKIFTEPKYKNKYNSAKYGKNQCHQSLIFIH